MYTFISFKPQIPLVSLIGQIMFCLVKNTVYTYMLHLIVMFLDFPLVLDISLIFTYFHDLDIFTLTSLWL